MLSGADPFAAGSDNGASTASGGRSCNSSGCLTTGSGLPEDEPKSGFIGVKSVAKTVPVMNNASEITAVDICE